MTKFNSLLIARNHFLIHKMQKVSINLFIIIKPFIDMNQDPSKMIVLEEKIIGLLNKLKENHLSINKYKDSNESLTDENTILKKKLLNLEEENKSLKIANNLLGSKDDKSFAKIKINNLIKEVDQCIRHLSEIE